MNTNDIIKQTLDQFAHVWRSSSLTFDEKVGFFCAHVAAFKDIPVDIVDLKSRADAIRAYMVDDQSRRMRELNERATLAEQSRMLARQAELAEKQAQLAQVSQQDRHKAAELVRESINELTGKLAETDPATPAGMELTQQILNRLTRLRALAR